MVGGGNSAIVTPRASRDALADPARERLVPCKGQGATKDNSGKEGKSRWKNQGASEGGRERLFCGHVRETEPLLLCDRGENKNKVTGMCACACVCTSSLMYSGRQSRVVYICTFWYMRMHQPGLFTQVEGRLPTLFVYYFCTAVKPQKRIYSREGHILVKRNHNSTPKAGHGLTKA